MIKSGGSRMNHHFYSCNTMLIELRHLERKVPEIDAFVKFREVTLDFQQQASQ